MRTDYDVKVRYNMDRLRELGKWSREGGDPVVPAEAIRTTYRPEPANRESERLRAIDAEVDKLLEEI